MAASPQLATGLQGLIEQVGKKSVMPSGAAAVFAAIVYWPPAHVSRGLEPSLQLLHFSCASESAQQLLGPAAYQAYQPSKHILLQVEHVPVHAAAAPLPLSPAVTAAATTQQAGGSSSQPRYASGSQHGKRSSTAANAAPTTTSATQAAAGGSRRALVGVAGRAVMSSGVLQLQNLAVANLSTHSNHSTHSHGGLLNCEPASSGARGSSSGAIMAVAAAVSASADDDDGEGVPPETLMMDAAPLVLTLVELGEESTPSTEGSLDAHGVLICSTGRVLRQNIASLAYAGDWSVTGCCGYLKALLRLEDPTVLQQVGCVLACRCLSYVVHSMCHARRFTRLRARVTLSLSVCAEPCNDTCAQF